MTFEPQILIQPTNLFSQVSLVNGLLEVAVISYQDGVVTLNEIPDAIVESRENFNRNTLAVSKMVLLTNQNIPGAISFAIPETYLGFDQRLRIFNNGNVEYRFMSGNTLTARFRWDIGDDEVTLFTRPEQTKSWGEFQLFHRIIGEFFNVINANAP